MATAGVAGTGVGAFWKLPFLDSALGVAAGVVAAGVGVFDPLAFALPFPSLPLPICPDGFLSVALFALFPGGADVLIKWLLF